MNQSEQVYITKNPNMFPNQMPNSGGVPNLPLDVSRELSQYQRLYISQQADYFRMAHCCDVSQREYLIWGELPDGDKKLIFTASRHFDCELCKCDNWKINICCSAYICCDQIIYQLDYRRNGKCFYTQGINMKKGCYCCKCNPFGCFNCDCPSLFSTLNLRENTDPDNVNFDVGVKKGKTIRKICECCSDKKVTYITQEGFQGPTTSADSCSICLNSCCKYYFFCISTNCGMDVSIDIKDKNGTKKGNITVYSGVCSKKKSHEFCGVPRSHMEINMPPDSTSEERFQIIADLVFLDLANIIL